MLYLSANSENVIYTEVSANKTLSNPTYLMSLTHAQTGKRWTFIPQNVSSYSGAPYNDRYDIFKFNISGGTQDLTGGTRTWLHKVPYNVVADDERYKGTGESYFMMHTQLPILANYYIYFDYADKSGMNELDNTGFTVSINDRLFTGTTSIQYESRGGGIFTATFNGLETIGGFIVENGFVSLNDVYKISYTGESLNGEILTNTVYVPTPAQVYDVKPWQFYDGNVTSPTYYKSYPSTHINTPVINIDEIGEFTYSIREQSNPINLDPSLSMEQLEVGLGYITEGFTDTFYDNSESSTVYNPD